MAADGQVASGTQTAYVLALHMNLVPDELRAAAADRLVAAIGAAGWYLTTGFAGVGYLLPVLSSTGHTAAAYRLLEQDTMPSWRYMTGHGATTIWERWDGWTAERGFASPEMNSFNHYALGSVDSGWRRDDGRFTFSLELPPNVTASVRIPSDDPAAVRDRAGSGPSRWPATLAPLVPPKRSSRSGRARTSSPAPSSPVMVVR